MNEFVTIAVFQYPHEAHILAGRLESEGIEVFLKDENTVQVHNFLSQAVGGVKLQVPENQVEQAVPILKELGLLNEKSEEELMAENQRVKEKTLPVVRGILILLFLVILIIAGMYW